MNTLCMDTSHTWLVLCLIQDGEVTGKVQERCWKRQSEEIFPKLIEMTESLGLSSDDIDEIVITEGPGSYTGVRIAMTIAKVFCAMKELPLYTIPTLQLYAGKNTCRVVTDARGKRVYTCAYEAGVPVEEERAVSIDELVPVMKEDQIIGDASLTGGEDNWPDIAENFLVTREFWKKAENVHTVVPEYLKSSQSYMPNRK